MRSTRAESRLSDPEATSPVAGEAARPPALRDNYSRRSAGAGTSQGMGVKVHHLRLTLGTPDTPADDTQSLRECCTATKGPTPKTALYLHYVRQNRLRMHPPTPPTHTHTRLLCRGSVKTAGESCCILFYLFFQEAQ